MELIKYPNPILLTRSEPVEITPEVRDFVFEMFSFMKTLPFTFKDKFDQDRKRSVAGLAAPQVGKNWRIFIAQNNVYINPEITWMPKAGMNPCKEGCFSLEPGVDYPISRAYAVKLKWQDLKGNSYEQRFNDFTAQVIQHEYDHLEGRLCCGETHV